MVVQKKTSEKEGYEAVQLGFEDIAERKLTKPEKGHLDKAGVAPKKYLREFDLENAADLNVGDIVKADTFQAGDFVDVTGISKGHGYAASSSASARAVPRPPTAAACAPSRRLHGLEHRSFPYLPGKKQAGHMGVDQVTVQNLDVVKVDPELNMIVVRGAIPRPEGRHCLYQEHRQEDRRQEGRRRHQHQPQKASGRNPQKASARK